MSLKQINLLLALIVRVLECRPDIHSLVAKGIPQGFFASQTLLTAASSTAFNCKGIFKKPNTDENAPIVVDTSKLATTTGGFDPQTTENDPQNVSNTGGGDKTLSTPQNPLKNLPRVAGNNFLKPQDFKTIDALPQELAKESIILKYASAIRNEEGISFTVKGKEVVKAAPKSTFGERAYNNRLYAKHLRNFNAALEQFPYAICFTKTAPEEFDILNDEIDHTVFQKEVLSALARFRKNFRAAYFAGFEYGKEGHLHCHGIIFLKSLPRGMKQDEKVASLNTNSKKVLSRYLDFKDFERVEWLDKSRAQEWFNYCHKYTRCNATQLFQAQKTGNEEFFNKAVEHFKNQMFCQRYGIKQWVGSSSKGLGLSSVKNDDILEAPVQTSIEKPVKNDDVSEIAIMLEKFANRQCTDKEGFLALKTAIEMVFPCATLERYIVNESYTPSKVSKLAQWRDKALKSSKIKSCNCLFKQLYFASLDAAEKSV